MSMVSRRTFTVVVNEWEIWKSVLLSRMKGALPDCRSYVYTTSFQSHWNWMLIWFGAEARQWCVSVCFFDVNNECSSSEGESWCVCIWNEQSLTAKFLTLFRVFHLFFLYFVRLSIHSLKFIHCTVWFFVYKFLKIYVELDISFNFALFGLNFPKKK